MTEARIQEIDALGHKMALVQNKTPQERKMLKAIWELLEAVKGKATTNEAEYQRGYKDGTHDERDRAYAARKAAKSQPKELSPEEDQPFGEVEG